MFGNKIYKSLLSLLIVIVVLVLVYNYQKSRTVEIKENGSLTIARLTSIHDGGEAFDYSIEYEYFVDEIRFTRTVEVAPINKKTILALKSNLNKKDYYAWIIYSNNNPSKSLINLSSVFEKKEKKKGPLNYEDFY